MLGDSIMRLHFYSLACLLRAHVVDGHASGWGLSDIRLKIAVAADMRTALRQEVDRMLAPAMGKWCLWFK